MHTVYIVHGTQDYSTIAGSPQIITVQNFQLREIVLLLIQLTKIALAIRQK